MTGAERDAARAALEQAIRQAAPQAAAVDLDTAARAIAETARLESRDRFYVGQKGAVAELDEALKAVERLQNKLTKLHGVTVAEVNVTAGSNRTAYDCNVGGQLSRLRDDLKTARDRIDRQGLLHAPPRSRAEHVADSCVYWLAKLRGEPPGVSHDSNNPAHPNRPSGPLVRLLQNTYDLFGIKANVEHAAKTAVKNWKQMRG